MTDADFRVLSFQPQLGHGTARPYQKRRKHHKSKAGCLGCKAKRVKCDERRPCCSRCERNHARCSYPSDEEHGSPGVSKVTRRPRNSVIHTNTLVDRCCMKLAASCPSTSPAITGLDPPQEHAVLGTPRVVLMHHFQSACSKMHLLGNTNVNSMLALGVARPFLLDALLAVSASHLRHHNYHAADRIRHETRMAEHSHQALAMHNFRSALAQLTLDQQTADAFVLTAMLLNLLMFSFNDDDDDPDCSWIFHPGDPQRLSWFSLQLGLKPLLVATERFRADSILGWLYNAPAGAASREQRRSPDSLPAHWMALLGSDAHDGASWDDNTILLGPARMLAEIREMEPRKESFLRYVSFVGAMDMDFRFRDLLEAEDERAVWLFGYWLGLMCRFDWWWIHMRVDREWRAICRWLNRRGVKDRRGEEGQIWRFLMRELEEAGSWPRPRGQGEMVSECAISSHRGPIAERSLRPL